MLPMMHIPMPGCLPCRFTNAAAGILPDGAKAPLSQMSRDTRRREQSRWKPCDAPTASRIRDNLDELASGLVGSVDVGRSAPDRGPTNSQPWHCQSLPNGFRLISTSRHYGTRRQVPAQGPDARCGRCDRSRRSGWRHYSRTRRSPA